MIPNERLSWFLHREGLQEVTLRDVFDEGIRVAKERARHLQGEAARAGFDNVVSFFDRLQADLNKELQR